MATSTNKLTNTAISKATAKETPYKLVDGAGMYLLIKPNGGKYWHLAYRFAGKQKTLALGVFPDVSLADARAKREAARKQLDNHIDPNEAKKEQKRQAILSAENSFKAIALEWMEKQPPKAEITATKNLYFLSMAFTGFGHKPITEVTAPDVLAVCRILENQNKLETAHRIKAKCGQVFRYAIATGRSTYDPTQALRGALKPIEAGHRAAITDPIEVAKLLTAINSYQGQFVTQCALKLAPLVFVRPGELRTALWQEIDLEAKEWRYNVSKTSTQHIVPLSRQAIAILTDLHQQTGHTIYVFPSVLTIKRPMSDNTINPALRRLGYGKDEMCGHGFRAMARTILEEVLEYPIEIIEQQLAHQVKDMHGRAYNRTKHLAKRHKMMQHWADYLDQLQGKNVIHADFGQQKPA
ncbi:MAG: integrase arm-type DNA-binding domain-containing protein [Agitococcus sp.]|nr:integrase arm-type DNA-binding domain-containing protein [Agitococcus sp.]